jgi:lauroyl/myristoyl acyltransferase
VFITPESAGRYTVECHRRLEVPPSGNSEADLRWMTRRANEVISAQIRHDPAHWLWLHRRWKQPLSLRADRTRAPLRRPASLPVPAGD